jgi:isopentenyl diphosphate isomerase/L-lactate dehydrogenase-like FMN-dependent dehydrogenase
LEIRREETMARHDRCYNIADLREMARRRLPKGVFQYLDLGTEDQVALRNNRRAFDDLKMRNKVLVDVSDVRTDHEIFGKPSAMPLAIAPTGIAGLCWYEGELELAKAAAAAGIPFTLATGSNTAMEKVAAEAGGRLWFQLYMWREKELSYELVKRAARAGFEALIWTVDIGHGANREHNARNGFATPYKLNMRSAVDVALHPEWLVTVLARYLAAGGMPRHENYPAKYQGSITGKSSSSKALRADKVSFDDIDRLRDIWPGKLIIKGILRADDALEAIDHGADAIVVSNHGGRNMDSAEASLVVLPEIVEAVAGEVPVILDSGIRRGSDLVKALALGADFVLSGRATLYGTAVGGQKGAEHALKLIKNEFVRTMAYVGCSRIGDISADVFGKEANTAARVQRMKSSTTPQAISANAMPPNSM